MDTDKRGQMGIGAIVGVLVLIVVAVALLPTINDSITAYSATNGTGADLLENVPLFVVIGILLAAIAGAGIAYMRSR